MDSSEASPSKINFTYTTGEAKGIAELRKDLKQALEPSLNKEIVNKEQGLSGVITTEEVKKIMSSKAVAKSVANGFSRDEHIEVAKHIERLFTESKLLRSHKDYKENPNILQVHRFVKDIEVNGKEANALITLFEKMQGKNKIYTIELESLENLPPLSTQAKSAETAVKAQSAAATPTEAAPIAKTDGQSIAQDSTKVQKVDSMLKSKAKAQGQRVEIQADQNTLTYKTQERQHIGALRTSLKEALKPYINKEIVNKATGISAQISSTGINKIASKMAVDKSIANGFTRDEHFAAAQDLKNLFENATKKTSYTDKKHSKDILSMHRFFTQITINNKQAQAKMTLKESIEYGNRIYSLELEELIPSP